MAVQSQIVVPLGKIAHLNMLKMDYVSFINVPIIVLNQQECHLKTGITIIFIYIRINFSTAKE